MKFAKHIIVICCAFLIAGYLCPKPVLSITVKQEEELSREFMKVIFNTFELVKDPLIVSYVENIGKKVLSVMPPQPYPFHFYIVKEDVYNAFAGPAGHIFINSGLFEAMEDEHELAGIISHEIAHVLCRHISEKLERAKKIGMATLAGIVAGIFLGSGGSETAAEAITVGSMAAGQSISLAYSRGDEIQADQLGLKYLTKAGYSGTGLITILKKIRNKQWFDSTQIPTYLTTHPALEDRIAYVDTWLESNAKAIEQLPSINSYEFERAHTRSVALYGPQDVAIKIFEAKVAKYPSSPMAHYGYGLILARSGSRKSAAAHLKIALEKRAFDPHILKDLGRIYFLDGRYPEALRVLEGATGILPDDQEALFFTGRILLELGRPKEAASKFETIIKQSSYMTQALFFLGEAYSKQGKPGEAHYYLGIFYKRKGKLKNASFHLKRALRNITDSVKKQKIEEMLKEIENKFAEIRKRGN